MIAKRTRRAVLKGLAVAGAGWWILPRSASAFTYEVNEQLAIAAVGLGSRGKWLAESFPRLRERVVAVCDSNRSRIDEVKKQLGDAEVFQDYRKMLDALDQRLDALVVATPDHTHAIISAAGIRRNKHVYCEKPIAHNVREARELRLLAAQMGVATQMGNQGMATDSFRGTLEFIEDGGLGEIREAHVWFVFGGSGPRTLPTDRPPIPPELDWDVWLGPAAERPYHPEYVFGWFGWWDFGTGCLGGGGSHSLNLSFKALRLRTLWDGPGAPSGIIKIVSQIPERADHGFPRWQVVQFHIPPRGNMPPAVIHWYNGSEEELKRQGIWQKLEEIVGGDLEWKDGSWTPRSGTLLVGSKGVVHTNAHNSVCRVLPADKFEGAVKPPRRLPHVAGHQQEWIAACKGRGVPISNFDHSGPVIELLLAANVAGRFDEALEFDPAACRIVNSAEADALLRPPYRSGWSL